MRRPVVLVPDVESVVITALSAALADRSEPYAASAKVQRTVPAATKPAPGTVTVRRDGGGTRLGVASARLGINVWHSTDRAATDLASLCSSLLAAAVDPSTPIRGYLETSGPSEIPDGTGPHRYFTAEVEVRGAPL